MKRFDGTEIPQADAERFRRFVKTHRWIFAKTYAKFCPHEYTLRRESGSVREFKWIAKFVWDNGFWAWYGKNESRYFIDEEDGWYYFVFKADHDDDTGEIKDSMTLLNRASMCQWELVEETDLFETRYRWKRLPKEKRRNPYEGLLEE